MKFRSNKQLFLIATAGGMVFYGVTLGLGFLLMEHSSPAEIFTMFAIFSLMMAFGFFCLLKGRQQMWKKLCGMEDSEYNANIMKPFYVFRTRHSKRVKRLYRVARVFAFLIWGYLMLYSIDPYSVEEAPLHILSLAGGMCLFFALAVIQQYWDAKEAAPKKEKQALPPLSTEQQRLLSWSMKRDWLLNFGRAALVMTAAYALLVYFGSHFIPATPWHVIVLAGIAVVCFGFALLMKNN